MLTRSQVLGAWSTRAYKIASLPNPTEIPKRLHHRRCDSAADFAAAMRCGGAAGLHRAEDMGAVHATSTLSAAHAGSALPAPHH